MFLVSLNHVVIYEKHKVSHVHEIAEMKSEPPNVCGQLSIAKDHSQNKVIIQRR